MGKKKIILIFVSNILAVSFWLIIVTLSGIQTAGVTESFKDLTNNFFSIVILGVIIAPVLEEFIFRYPLINKNTSTNVWIVLGCLYAYQRFNFLLFFIFLVISIINFIHYNRYKKERAKRGIVIGYILVFALMHYGNFDTVQLEQLSFIGFIFQFLPHAILGICVSYIRMQSKFIYVVIYHASYNLFILSMYHILSLLFA
ncbi:MAG: CPBP family intramembrane metalloprotease [Tannerella sp.]|jgi:hypothetical protein|nr:CPBP family intramembrane metalloprotease [Tannerella sp.]